MTFRVTGARIAKVYDRVIELYNAWYESATTIVPKMSGGTVNTDELEGFYERTVGVRDAAAAAIATASNARLIAYAKVDEDDDTYEVATEYTTARAALLAVINEFDNNFVWKADDTAGQVRVPAVYTSGETDAVRLLVEAAQATMS